MPVREKRSVLRSLFSPGSKKYWNLKTEHARLLFLVLLTNADDFGRLEGAPEDLKSLIPRSDWDIKSIATYIVDLKRCGLVLHYKVKGEWYIEVVDFWENQDRHGVTQVPSKFPPATGVVLSENHNGVQDSDNGVPQKQHSTHIYMTTTTERKEESEKETIFDFRQFRRKWKAVVRKSAKSTDTNRKFFDEACTQYGMKRVLASIEPWAEEQDEGFLRGPSADWAFLKEGVHDYAGEEPEQEEENSFPRM